MTGATGAIGPAVVRALAAASVQARAFARTAPAPDLLPRDVEVATGDVADAAAVRRAMRDVQLVVHLAARLHVPNPPAETFPEYERVNVAGTRAVIDAAREAGVARVVYVSSIAVYGPTGGQLLSESSSPAPDTIYAKTKRAGEVLALGAAASGGPAATVLRLGAVYGPRVKGNYRRLLDALARGRFVPIGPGRNRRTLVHEEDVARAVVLAATHPDAAGEPFNVTDGACPTLAEIIDAMCRALGRRLPAIAVSEASARFAAAAAERTARLAGRRLPLSATIDKYLEDVAVDGSRLAQRLGFQPAFDLRAGWRQTVDVLRRAGEL